MQSRTQSPQPITVTNRRNLIAILPLVIFFVIAFAGMSGVYRLFGGEPVQEIETIVNAEGVPVVFNRPIFKIAQARPVTQRISQSAGPFQLAIIAGHKDSDSGAVCDDGLTEVEITEDLTNRLVARLQQDGIPTLVFSEFDPRLDGFQGTGLVSIHADSCQYINDLATGFKLSGSWLTDSGQLAGCIHSEYAAATGMGYHANTITIHMEDYHVFRKIGMGTQAIILEVGFMALDREILTTNADVPVEGIYNGIKCYIDKLAGIG